MAVKAFQIGGEHQRGHGVAAVVHKGLLARAAIADGGVTRAEEELRFLMVGQLCKQFSDFRPSSQNRKEKVVGLCPGLWGVSDAQFTELEDCTLQVRGIAGVALSAKPRAAAVRIYFHIDAEREPHFCRGIRL